MKKNPLADYARYGNFALSFGLTLIISLLLGYWGGNWLDSQFGTSPFLMLLGILLGVFISFRSLLAELQVLTQTRDLGKEQEEISDKEDKGAKRPW